MAKFLAGLLSCTLPRKGASPMFEVGGGCVPEGRVRPGDPVPGHGCGAASQISTWASGAGPGAAASSKPEAQSPNFCLSRSPELCFPTPVQVNAFPVGMD